MSVFLQPIYTQTVGSGGAASVTFNSIPQTFTDLKVVVSARSTNASVGASLYYTINGNGTNIYSETRLDGNGASATSARETIRGSAVSLNVIPGANATSNTFGNLEIYIPNYTSSNFKSVIMDGVSENNATTAYQELGAQLIQLTSAISSITLSPDSNFDQYTTITIYGILRQGI